MAGPITATTPSALPSVQKTFTPPKELSQFTDKVPEFTDNMVVNPQPVLPKADISPTLDTVITKRAQEFSQFTNPRDMRVSQIVDDELARERVAQQKASQDEGFIGSNIDFKI